MARKSLPRVLMQNPVHLRRRYEPSLPTMPGDNMNRRPHCEHVVIVPNAAGLVHLEFDLGSPFYCAACQHPKVIAEQLLAMLWGYA